MGPGRPLVVGRERKGSQAPGDACTQRAPASPLGASLPQQHLSPHSGFLTLAPTPKAPLCPSGLPEVVPAPLPLSGLCRGLGGGGGGVHGAALPELLDRLAQPVEERPVWDAPWQTGPLSGTPLREATLFPGPITYQSPRTVP